MSKKDKKQQSLFDFPALKKHSSVASSYSLVIVIEDEDKVEQTDVKFESQDDSSVTCPVCSTRLGLISLDLRVRHVEQCLTGSHEQKPQSTEPESNCEKPKSADLLVKKPLGQVQVHRAKYVNSVSEARKKRRIAVSEIAEDSTEKIRELLPSSKRYEIPELKVLRFYASPSQEYCVSVDAFNYKPHELIRQYFLSHFHSDHYGGITKRWSLERTIDSKIIYCSSITARLLTIRFNIDPKFIFDMENDKRYIVQCYTDGDIEHGGKLSEDTLPGLYVTLIDANHCPGAVIFLFESVPFRGEATFYLHCGDFRINATMLNHPLLAQFHLNGSRKLAKVYLDTTYMNPSYNFPKQEQVCSSIANFVSDIVENKEMTKDSFGKSLQSRITQFLSSSTPQKKKKCLVLVGTYLIGKERIAMSILKQLGGCPIFVSNINSRGDKLDIVKAFQHEYLDSVLTDDPLGNSDHPVVVHLVPMKIVGTLKELTSYFNFNKYHDSFERCVGLRPTGWTFQSGSKDNSETPENIPESSVGPTQDTIQLLKTSLSFTSQDILRQNPYTAKKYAKFDPSTYRVLSLPYSEHLSFRELCYFVVFLRIGQVIPTVNTHNPESAKRMADIIASWEELRRQLSSNKNADVDAPALSLAVSLSDF